jgi:peptidoglycan/xylan/chitin deacetylase (PgdA/CDA1 family)
VITFDDGFQNNYDVCYPILLENGLPATIFLCTGYINTGDTVWFCKLDRAMSQTTKSSLEWNLSRFDLSSIGSRAKASNLLQEKLKDLPQPILLRELFKILLALDDDPDRPIEIGSPYRMLSCSAITEMASSGLIEFGAHTQTHAILSRLSWKECIDEIEGSMTAVRKVTGRPCELFAYPNGCIDDYNNGVIRILESYGVRAAVTTIEGPNDSKTSLMELRRYGIGPNLSLAGFQMRAHHIMTKLRRMIP